MGGMFIPGGTFINFQKKIQGVRLFRGVRLFWSLEYITWRQILISSTFLKILNSKANFKQIF